MPLYSLREYIKEKSEDFKRQMQEGGMSEKTLANIDIHFNRHFRIKVLLAILEQPDPHNFWKLRFEFCAYNVFKIGVEVVLEKVREVVDEL